MSPGLLLGLPGAVLFMAGAVSAQPRLQTRPQECSFQTPRLSDSCCCGLAVWPTRILRGSVRPHLPWPRPSPTSRWTHCPGDPPGQLHPPLCSSSPPAGSPHPMFTLSLHTRTLPQAQYQLTLIHTRTCRVTRTCTVGSECAVRRLPVVTTQCLTLALTWPAWQGGSPWWATWGGGPSAALCPPQHVGGSPELEFQSKRAVARGSPASPGTFWKFAA